MCYHYYYYYYYYYCYYYRPCADILVGESV